MAAPSARVGLVKGMRSEREAARHDEPMAGVRYPAEATPHVSRFPDSGKRSITTTRHNTGSIISPMIVFDTLLFFGFGFFITTSLHNQRAAPLWGI
jgi:hypothetical protein